MRENIKKEQFTEEWRITHYPTRKGPDEFWINIPQDGPMASQAFCVHGRENAHLIVAAPALLVALKYLREEIRAKGILKDVRKNFSLMSADAMAGTAIHKAEGNSTNSQSV